MNHNAAETAIDTSAAWLPFTPNGSFKNTHQRIVVAAQGMEYTKHDGGKLLDGASGLWCVTAGHNRSEINDAIHKQLNTLDYAPAFQFGSDVMFKAARKIVDLAPSNLTRTMFTSSGSEAVDTAFKAALAYHRARGEGHRNVFIGREKAYHGVGFSGISAGGLVANRKSFNAMLPRVDHLAVPWDLEHTAFTNNDCPEWGAHFADELEKRIIPLHDASNIAAVIIEPVQGSAGWILPPKGYVKKIREICDRHGLLLIFDEVITGFGRMGEKFGADYFGVQPDMMTYAKCVTNGVFPLGGVLFTDKIYDTITNNGTHLPEFFHGYTYSGHPGACAAAIATLDLYERDDLFNRAKQMAVVLGNKLQQLKGLPNVISVRTAGLAGAVEMAPEAGKPGKRGYETFMRCFDKGVYSRPAGDAMILAPAFIVTEAQIDQLVNTLGDAIRAQA